MAEGTEPASRELTLAERFDGTRVEHAGQLSQMAARLSKLEAFMGRVFPDFVPAHMEPKVTEGPAYRSGADERRREPSGPYYDGPT